MRTLTLAVLLAPGLALGAMAQDKPATPPTPQAEQQAAPPASATRKVETGTVLTDEQMKAWIDKPVYSSDGKQLGEVVAFARDADNVVTEMHADIGGFLGLGETRVKLTAGQFELKRDRVILDVSSAQAKGLPNVE